MELIEARQKKTEYGNVPYDWSYCKFEDLLTGFSSGMTPYRGIPEYYEGDIPWVTSGELKYNIINDTIEKITKDAVSKTNLKVLPKGTFLMAITGLEAAGTRGSCAITGIECTTNQSCMALFPIHGKILTEYLYHFYVRYGDQLAFKYCQGTKQQSYTGRLVKILPIVVPPTLAEQKAIATALSDVDALITGLDKLIEKKKAIKQGAMQELLTGKTRLAGFGDGAGYKMTEVGRIPGDWEVRKLGSCLLEQPKYGIGAAAVNFNLNLPTYLRITDIDEEGRLIESELKSVDHIDATDYFLDDGDIVLARTGASVGKSYFYQSEGRKLVYAGFLIKIKTNPGLLFPAYLNAYLKTSFYRSWVTIMSMRSGQPGINSTEYASLPIPLPPSLSEQIAIAEILSDLDSETQKLEFKRDKYKQIKLGMMQELLTGKTRLI